MRKYIVGRVVAWTLIVCSLVFSAGIAAATVLQLGGPLPGLLDVRGSVHAFGAGLLAALIGVAFLAAFDMAEAYVRRQP
jgi:hypothetical protein